MRHSVWKLTKMSHTGICQTKNTYWFFWAMLWNETFWGILKHCTKRINPSFLNYTWYSRFKEKPENWGTTPSFWVVFLLVASYTISGRNGVVKTSIPICTSHWADEFEQRKPHEIAQQLTCHFTSCQVMIFPRGAATETIEGATKEKK